MARRICIEDGCGQLTDDGETRCRTHALARRRARPSTTTQGYGTAHQKLRQALLPQAIGQPCTRCGEPIQPSESVELDHTDDRIGYLGFAHAACNRSAGGRRGRSARRV